MAVKTFKVINGVKTPVSPASLDAEMQNRYNESVFNKKNPGLKQINYNGERATVKDGVNGSVSMIGNPNKPTEVEKLPYSPSDPDKAAEITKLPYTGSAPSVTPFNYSQTSVSSGVNLNEGGNKMNQGADDIMLTEYFAGRPNARVILNDETKDVYINGVAVPKNEVYLSGGKAFVSRELAENILKFTQRNDPSSPDAMHERYGKLINNFEDKYNALNSADPFEYDYKKDPSFKAYSDYYNVLADAAVDEALSSLMSRTGGYVNSNALGAAYKARNNFMRELANVIPQLEQQAYTRYADEKKLKSDNIHNALANIRELFGDYTGAINDQQNRQFNYDELGVNDANVDAARESQDAYWNGSLKNEADSNIIADEHYQRSDANEADSNRIAEEHYQRSDANETDSNRIADEHYQRSDANDAASIAIDSRVADAQIKKWEQETGISWASLSLDEQRFLLDSWIAEQDYGKKPSDYTPKFDTSYKSVVPPDTLITSSIPLN